jgi:AraC-like DNA-binding protein
MEQNGKQFWMCEAKLYFDECRRSGSCVRASEFALRMQRTPVQLAREFHAVVGLCIKDYFNDLRLERAKEMLRTTGRSTAEVATGSGFASARSFYRAFRRMTGISPTDYRKEMSLAAPPFRH